MKKTAILFLVLIAFTAHADSPQEILFIGDSIITWPNGARATSTLGLANREPAGRFTSLPYVDDADYDFGMGGGNFYNWTLELGDCDFYEGDNDWTMQFGCVRQSNAQIVAILLGANDVCLWTEQHDGDISLARDRGIDFINRTKALGKKVILISEYPMEKDEIPYYGDAGDGNCPGVGDVGGGDFCETPTDTDCASPCACLTADKCNCNLQWLFQELSPYADQTIDVFQQIRDDYADTNDFIRNHSSDRVHITATGHEILWRTYIQPGLLNALSHGRMQGGRLQGGKLQ